MTCRRRFGEAHFIRPLRRHRATWLVKWWRVYNPTRNNPSDGVIVLTASWCGYCESLRRHLLEQKIPYTELDVDHTTEGRFGFKVVRARGIPVTIIGQHVIRGVGKKGTWDEIDTALKGAGYPLAEEAHATAQTHAAAETDSAPERRLAPETHAGAATSPEH